MNLLLAIYYEHKARTGHDPFQPSLRNCDVCLMLNAEKRDMDKAEARHFAEIMEAENTPVKTCGTLDDDAQASDVHGGSW
jgi:hypothetical protein